MKLRTYHEALREVRDMDAKSCVTVNCIKNLVKSGKVHFIKTGKKVLIDVDSLYECLYGETK